MSSKTVGIASFAAVGVLGAYALWKQIQSNKYVYYLQFILLFVFVLYVDETVAISIQITRKRFSEKKPIVAFTNSAAFILDFNI